MIRLILTAVVAFGAYIIMGGVTASFYQAGIDIPGIELSRSIVTWGATIFIAFTAFIKLDD